ETYDFASCVLSPKTNDSFSTVDVKLLPKSDVKDPSLTNDLPSCSFKENVKPPRNLCNKSGTVDRIPCKNTFVHPKKCFVCGTSVPTGTSIHACRSIPAASRNGSASIHAGRSIHAASRNGSASIHAARSIPAVSRNKPASIHAGKHIPAGRINKPAPFPASRSVPTDDGVLSLSPQQVVLGDITDLICNGVPRIMVDLINLHGLALNDQQVIGIVDSSCSRSMTGNKDKLDDFVQVKGGTVKFRGGDGKQHKASYKAISAVRIISEPLQLLHMDLFGPTSIRSINHKYYSLVVTDDFKNQLNKKVKAIRCDNGTEFRNAKLIALCGEKGIKRDYSNARTPKQNGFAERKNRTLIEAASSMLADSKLPIIFWTEAVSTACYVLNRVSITNPHHKTPYELLSGKVPNIRHLKPFSKKVEDTLNLRYLEDKPNVQGTHNTNILAGTHADDSEFECDELPSFPSNSFLGPMIHDVFAPMKNNLDYAEELARLQRQEYEAHSAAAKPGFEFSVDTAVPLPQADIKICRNLVPAVGDPAGSIVSTSGVPAGSLPTSSVPAGSLPTSSVPAGSLLASCVPASSVPASGVLAGSIVSTGGIPTCSVSASGVPAGSVPASSVPTSGVLAGSIVFAAFGDPAASASLPVVLTNTPATTSPLPPGHSLGSCEPTTRFPFPSDLGNHQPMAGIFSSSSYDDDFCADVTNLALNVAVDLVATKRVNIIHPQSQIIRALQSPVQTRSTVQKSKFGESAFISYVHTQNRTNHADHLRCLFSCFLSQLEPSSVAKSLEDPNWIAIVTKWILKNKRDARGIVVRNKSRLVAQGDRQEEGIDYDKVFALVARIEAICLFLAFASYIGFMVYQMDVKSAFLYGEIEEEVYVTQPKGFEDPYNPKHVNRVDKALYGLHQAPRACQDKYVKDMLKKFDMESMRTATTPYEVPKHKSKDEPDDAVNVHLFRSMIGSLMYLTASRPDIMFAMSACSRHQVTPLTSHLNAVKKIFKYLKGHPNLGLWYPRYSPFQLEAYSDSDYAGSHGDRKSTTGGCQFLGRSLISWQCKKQTVVATSSTEAKYVAAASCCGQVLWIQNQMLDYGFNFMNTMIFIDNQSTICIVKNLVFHQQIKHIEIRHHFIRDAYEKNLIQLLVRADDLVPAGSCIIPTDDHNKVSYLEKGKGWEAYEQILNFLNQSHIRYALTHRPTIVFDSLVKQFWATATVRTQETGPSDIISTINGNKVVVTESLIRTQLQLDDTTDPSTRPTFNFTAKLFSNVKLNWDGPHMPPLAPMLVVPAVRDGADAVAVHDVSPPPIVSPTHSTSGPSSVPQVTPVRDPTPMRDPTSVRVPTPSPVRAPTPDSPRPPSPPPITEVVGLTTSTRPSSPTRHTSVHADISEGGGEFVSSPQSNEASQTPTGMATGRDEDSAALTALSLKLDRCLNRVTTLENELGITKKVLGGAGEDTTPMEQDIDLEALHTLAHTSLGGDSSDTPAGRDAAKVPADTSMPSRNPSTTRRRLKKPFSFFAFAHFPEEVPAGASVPAATTTIPAGTMVDDSLPVDLLSEQEHVLKNLHDSQLGEELAKKIHAEQEAEFARQQEELAQKAQAERVASPTEHGDDVTEENMNKRLGMLLLRKRRELAEQSMVKPMTKTQQRDYMQDFVKNNSASVYNQGWTMKKVKALSIAQLRLEFEYIQQLLERSNLLNFRRSAFRPKPTLETPSAKRANHGAPRVHAASSQVPTGVPAALSFPADVSAHAATSSAPADILVPAVSTAHAAASVPAEPMVHTAESHVDDPLTVSEHVSIEPTVAAPTPLPLRTRRKHIAKKRVTPIVDMADAA
nr:hypothetical protein [Tanacetum cinerariifolium]